MSKGVSRMEGGSGLAREYLKEPYSRVLIPDVETGTYTAKIAEFPGCIAQGDTPEEAYRNLEAAAESWIEELLDMGQQVPEPAVNNQYSGRIALRLPKSLHRKAAQLAEREGTSLNQFLVAAIAEQVGSGGLYARMPEWLEAWATRAIANPAASITGTTFQTTSAWTGPTYGQEVLTELGSPAIFIGRRADTARAIDRPSEFYLIREES